MESVTLHPQPSIPPQVAYPHGEDSGLAAAMAAARERLEAARTANTPSAAASFSPPDGAEMPGPVGNAVDDGDDGDMALKYVLLATAMEDVLKAKALVHKLALESVASSYGVHVPPSQDTFYPAAASRISEAELDSKHDVPDDFHTALHTTSAEPAPQSGDDAQVTIRIREDKELAPRPSCGRAIYYAFYMLFGIAVQKGVVTTVARHIADVAHVALAAKVVERLSGGDEDTDARNAMACLLGLMPLHIVINQIVLKPAMSAMFTSHTKDGQGNVEAKPMGGSCHEALVTAAAHVATACTLAAGLLSAWDQDSSAKVNRFMVLAVLSALQQTLYAYVRGVQEIGVAKSKLSGPSRTLMDENGEEVSDAAILALIWWRLFLCGPLHILNCIQTVDAIFTRKIPELNAVSIAGANPSASVWIGEYEALASLIDLFVLWAYALKKGWRLELGRKPSETPSTPADKAQEARKAADDLYPAGGLELAKAKRLVDSIRLKPKSYWTRFKQFFESDKPDIFKIVMGYRLYVNLSLLVLLHPWFVALLGGVSNSVKIVGTLVGISEVLALQVQAGAIAQAAEGKADRVLFDKLHHLSKLEEDAYAKRRGVLAPDREKRVLYRRFHPSTLELIADSPNFDDVREHLRKLDETKPSAQGHFNVKNFWQQARPAYPPKAMIDAFGKVQWDENILADSPLEAFISMDGVVLLEQPEAVPAGVADGAAPHSADPGAEAPDVMDFLRRHADPRWGFPAGSPGWGAAGDLPLDEH